jgi:hypothetical protein
VLQKSEFFHPGVGAPVNDRRLSGNRIAAPGVVGQFLEGLTGMQPQPKNVLGRTPEAPA